MIGGAIHVQDWILGDASAWMGKADHRGFQSFGPVQVHQTDGAAATGVDVQFVVRAGLQKLSLFTYETAEGGLTPAFGGRKQFTNQQYIGRSA